MRLDIKGKTPRISASSVVYCACVAYTRVHRLLRILSLLQGARGWNARALAHECETSVRTIYRDIEQLQAAGIPVHFDAKANRYRVSGSFFMPPVHLTGEEALALSALCEHISKPERIPFLKPAWRALHKIESQLPQEIRDDVAARSRSITIRTAKAMPPDGYGDVYDKVQSAIASGKALQCRYEPATGERAATSGNMEFLLYPYALFFAVRAWYVVGKRSDRKELRSLKLNRFSSVAMTNESYRVPPGFDLDKHLGNAWRMIRGGADVKVELWFTPEFATTIADTLWHRTQSVEWHPDDSCTFRCTVSGLSEIEWWVLSMGPNCIVRKPRELAKRVRDLASATAGLYSA